MSLPDFRASRPLTLGVELELQILDKQTYDLRPVAASLLEHIDPALIAGEVKPEITCSMIEMSTGICDDHAQALAQLRQNRDVLVNAARQAGAALGGGGTHPFQLWSERQIFDAPRFHQIEQLYGYLSKQFTIFGQHVHVGCVDGDQALRLLHGMSRYIPHLIALSASSPFVQGVDTGFQSARLNSVYAFPLSGRAPFVTTWQEFGRFYDRMSRTGIVTGMKDFYWDIRPKPEFGTIEVRVLDTPLTVEKAAALAGLVQAIAHWLTANPPAALSDDDYLPYAFNRFQACRFGLDGVYVDPVSGERSTLREGTERLLDTVEPSAQALGGADAIDLLRRDMRTHGNDATWLRQRRAAGQSLPDLLRAQAGLWSGASVRDAPGGVRPDMQAAAC